jgi:hypothetical protein
MSKRCAGYMLSMHYPKVILGLSLGYPRVILGFYTLG